ncbi:MAG TPA: tryptophan--tRNA ligase [archaeon]|nr:tryptophan--tRNA ligase [archaeon]
MEDRIDPWGSFQIKDYDKVFKEFGLNRIPEDWKDTLDHHLFSRGIVIAHRDFNKIISRVENRQPFIMMTGIASSGRMHIGHKLIVDLALFMKSIGARMYFGIADIDGYVSRSDMKVDSMQKAKEFAANNLANALALGLDKKDVYIQSRYKPRYYEFAFELSKKITVNTFEGIYGHLDLGKMAANFLQYADILHPQLKEFEGKMPSVTPVALDQDPHIRAVRDIAKRLPYNMELPTSIYPVHLPGLKPGSKMSSSVPESSIFLDDTPEEVEKKIRTAFSGGAATLEEHRKHGGNPDVDVAFQILKFHCPDDKKVNQLRQKFLEGTITSGEMKEEAIKFVIKFLKEHQRKFKKFEPVARKMVFG